MSIAARASRDAAITAAPILGALLERATRPDRELDALICAELRVGPTDLPEWAQRWSEPWKAHGERVFLLHAGGGLGPNFPAARLTSDLNLVLALVEEKLPGVWWLIGKGRTRATEPLYGAQLMFGEEVIAAAEHEASAALAVLKALVAALPRHSPETPDEPKPPTSNLSGEAG